MEKNVVIYNNHGIKIEKTPKDKEVSEAERIKLKDIMATLKFSSLVGIVVNAIFVLTTIILCVLALLNINVTPEEELINNESVVSYISKVNNNSIEDTKYEISISSKGELIVFDVVFPSLFILSSLICMIVFCSKMQTFTAKVKTDKELFTKQKLKELTILSEWLQLAGFTLMFVFGFYYIIRYLFFVLILEIILYLFNYCVNYNRNKN